MVVAAVESVGQLEKLRELLATMNSIPGHANPDNDLVPFSRFDGLHFARFVIIESDILDEIKEFGKTPRPWKPSLAFICEFDGDRKAFLAELEEKASSGLKEIFSFCVGFSEQVNLQNWMKKHNIEPSANYINWIGRTVKQVHEEAALHKSLAKYLQEIVEEVGRENTRDLRQMLLSHVEMEKHEGRLALTPADPTTIGWKICNFLHMITLPLILLLLTPLFIVIAPFYAIRLRMLEQSEPELYIRPKRKHIQALSAQEDFDVTNQYSVFGDVKPGLFRLYSFKFVLLLTNYLARHVFNRGFLARIKTIHFARWVFMDNNHRVFFISNYDGSHESYMDDFINKVGFGLNLTFSNAVGYPTTKWIIKQGAEKEQAFKYTQRRHQIPTQVWYKAYPGLTTKDLIRNSLIRKGVEIRQSSDAEIRYWLSQV